MDIVNKLLGTMDWARRSLRRRGFLATVKVATSSAADLYFDWRFGTDTRTEMGAEHFEQYLANRKHAVMYQPSKAGPFLKLMQQLDIPERSTFMDVGCGKGKVLLLAASSEQHRFKRVVGLEFSRALCERARKNIEIFGQKRNLLAPIQIVEGDASQYEFVGDENVIFLYNPFNGTILARFLERLRDSLARHPRQIWLLYSVPVHADVVDASGFFSRSRTLNFGGNDVYVYTSQLTATAFSGR